MVPDRDFWTDPLDAVPKGDAPPVDEQIRALAREIALGSDSTSLPQAIGEVGIGPTELG